MTNYEPVPVFLSLRHFFRSVSRTGSAPWSALRAEPPENQLAFAQNPFPKRAGAGPRHVEPVRILHIAATVADEVVMPHACRIEARGTALDGHLSHQTRLNQVPQIVISGGPGRARIRAIHGFEDFRGRGMAVVLHQ